MDSLSLVGMSVSISPSKAKEKLEGTKLFTVSSPVAVKKGLLYSGVYRPSTFEGVTVPKRPKTPPRAPQPTDGIREFESLASSRFVEEDEQSVHSVSKSVKSGLPPNIPLGKKSLPTALSADSIQWINRHRPKNSVAVAGYIMPSQEIQLREMFDVLDTDKSGEIDIIELKRALSRVVSLEESRAKPLRKYLADQECLTPDERELAPDYRTPQDLQGNAVVPLVKHKKLLNDFFDSMDTDKSGSVDFDEFAQAMIHSDGNMDCMKRNTRLKQAFYDLASVVQRNKILGELQRNEVTTIDASCTNLRKLFNINYFLNDTVYDSSMDTPHKYQAYLKEIRPKEFVQMRQTEKTRCNSACQRLLTPKELPPIEKRKLEEHQRQYQFTALASNQLAPGEISLSGSQSSVSLYNKSTGRLSSARASTSREEGARIMASRKLLSANGRRLHKTEWNAQV